MNRNLTAFRDFLAALWPTQDKSKAITGKRLSEMHKHLGKQRKNDAAEKADGSRAIATNG